MIINDDCVRAMGQLGTDCIDAIVTDPPYELGFMGKSWDSSGVAFQVDTWRRAFDVLKPGGHLLAFSGSRTYHRIVCAIEDAGFEIRDQVMWVYSSGFPKSHNLDNLRGSVLCGCAVPYTHEQTEPPPECDVRLMRHADVSAPQPTTQKCGQVLRPRVQEPGVPGYGAPDSAVDYVWPQQSCMEGRRDVSQAQGKLRASEVCAVPAGMGGDGAQGRLCDGASVNDGALVQPRVDANGVCASRGPQPPEQFASEPGVMAGQQEPQISGAWPLCRGCGKPVVPVGWGTALKPAHEPICVARKPLIGTVAANVLAHGTGGINIDGCRVPGWKPQVTQGVNTNATSFNVATKRRLSGDSDEGRWPANLIHDGSDEVLAGFPQAPGQIADASVSNTRRAGQNVYGAMTRGSNGQEARAELDKSAARFFYCAKASKSDRGEGNVHPTVKPTALMRYLVRLVTPPGGIVLDPFAGSGSTGVACAHEGFSFIGIEREEAYAAIARARIEAVR